MNEVVMVSRLVKNSIFITGLVLVVVGLLLMLAGLDLFAGLLAAIGLLLAIVAAVNASKIPPETRSFAQMDTGPSIVDLDGDAPKSKASKVVDLDQ